MEASRDDAGRLYGPPRITLIPSQSSDEPPTLHTNRVAGLTSKFHFLQPPEAWYPPARNDWPRHLHAHEQRKQKRWIHGTRPDAITGIPLELLSDLLFEQDAAPATVGHRPLLAIGQMTDMTRARTPKPKALLATAAGSSGELLRLTALQTMDWQWEEHPDPTLRMIYADRGDSEDVSLWSLDDSPIAQIKVALNLAKQEPSRYVIVQKKLSTTVLRPLYRRLPVPGITQGTMGGTLERPSRVDPRPALTITSDQTGARPHADVAFNPGSSGRPEQLAIVDDGGFWTVWDMQGKIKIGSLDFDPRLRYCGHIHDGILEGLSNGAALTPEPHGILWIGPAEADRNHWDAALDTLADSRPNGLGYQPFASSRRSRTLLVWNATNMVLVNLGLSTSQNIALPLLKTQSDRILHVLLNPANQSQVFVLTSTTVFWIDLMAHTSEEDTKAPAILLSCAHLRSDEGVSLAMTANHGWPALGDDASLVCLFSPMSPDLDIFVFRMNEAAGLPQFQHHKIRPPSPGKGMGERPSIQTICVAPATLYSDTPGGPGAASLERDDRFWQLFVLDEALGLQCSLVTAAKTAVDSLEAPNTCLELSTRRQRIVQKRRRVDAIRRLAETFVVPDSFGDLDDLVRRRQFQRQQQSSDDEEEGGEAEVLPPRWPLRGAEGMSLLASRIGISIETVASESDRIRKEAGGDAFSSVELVHQALASPLADSEAVVPLKTLHDYGAPFEAPPTDEQTENAWDTQFRELIHHDNPRVVVEPVIPSFLGLDINMSTTLESLGREIHQIWSSQHISPTARFSRQLALAEVTEAAMRSLYGVVVLDSETADSIDGLPSWVPEPDATERHEHPQIQQSPYLTPRATQSLSPGPSSRASSHPGSSQPSRSSSREPPSADAAFKRLSLLAPSLNASLKPHGRPHPILSYWPATRGVPTSQYESSVATASTQRIADARSLFQRSEPRRRQKRPRITAEPDAGTIPGSSQTLPPLRPTITPAPPPLAAKSDAPFGVRDGFSSPRRPEAAITSQQVPMSSQGMGLGIMSQPVPGQHGRRAVVKKKRKGGF